MTLAHRTPHAVPDAPPGERSDDFHTLPAVARVFVIGTIVAGFAVLGVLIPQLHLEKPVAFASLLALSLLSATVKLSLPLSRSRSTLSLSFALNLLTLLMLDTDDAVVIGMLSAWAQCSFRQKSRTRLYRMLFSVATVIIAIFATGAVFVWFREGHQGFLYGVLRPLAPATTVYFFVNTLLVACAVALSTRQSLLTVWMSSFLWSAPSYFVTALGAAIAADISRHGNIWWAVISAVPLYLTYRSYRSFIERLEEERAQVRQLTSVQLATIEALALAIEVKDRTSHAQVRRMQVYAEGLARAMDMPEEDIPGVKTAALLHDIGHLAVPEHILSKPASLSYEEFERVKIHPRVGADILAMVPFPYPVSPLILAHHERWNGTGYPEGLRERDIPLGARVLAVSDTFASLLFDRPYRKARSYSEAIATLRACAGVSLDPEVVERFLEILPVLEIQVQHADQAPQAAVTFGALGPTALADIAGAHNEAKVLYEIAQALGTSLSVEETVQLVSTKLEGLLPFSCSALFLGDGTTKPLVCRTAIGTSDHEVERLQAPSMQALTGMLPSVPGAETPLCSVLVSPLVVGSTTVGAFALYHVQDAYQPEHRRVLELVARQAAPVIQNALVFEAAQEASLTDPLTGLANRRALQQHLAKELARAARQGARFSVLLLDMDGLKYFNDQFGHHTGDRAIREVSNVLRPLLRSYDLCARFAGDEFVVALWECDIAEADVRRRELQESVSRSTIEVSRGRTLTLGISAGAATFPDDGNTAEELLAAADNRMYQDKHARKHGGAMTVPTRDQDSSPLRAAV